VPGTVFALPEHLFSPFLIRVQRILFVPVSTKLLSCRKDFQH